MWLGFGLRLGLGIGTSRLDSYGTGEGPAVGTAAVGGVLEADGINEGADAGKAIVVDLGRVEAAVRLGAIAEGVVEWQANHPTYEVGTHLVGREVRFRLGRDQVF